MFDKQNCRIIEKYLINLLPGFEKDKQLRSYTKI